MNAVELEHAISQLAEQVFDRAAVAFQFLDAFGNKATTIKRLKSGSTNSSDIEGGVLQRNNIPYGANIRTSRMILVSTAISDNLFGQ